MSSEAVPIAENVQTTRPRVPGESNPPLSSLLTLLEFQSSMPRQTKDMVQRQQMAHFPGMNSPYPLQVAAVQASAAKRVPMYHSVEGKQPGETSSDSKQPVTASALAMNRPHYRSEQPANQVVNKFMRGAPQVHQIPVPQVLPRYVVRCTVSNGAQRYGAKLKLFGKQLRIGSKYADVMSASKVASSAKRFLRQDEVTQDFFIEPSPHLSQLTCLIFCSRDTNEIKEVPVATVLHNFVRVSNIKSAHKRVSDSHFQGQKGHKSVKKQRDSDQAASLAQMVGGIHSPASMTTPDLKRALGGPAFAWKVEAGTHLQHHTMASPSSNLGEPASKKQCTSGSRQPFSGADMTQVELMQRINEMQSRFATPVAQRTLPNGTTMPGNPSTQLGQQQAYSAEDISLIYRHFCLIYEKVSMAHTMLSKFLETSPELPFQSQKLAFTSLSCLQRVLKLLNPPSKKRPRTQGVV